MNKLLPIISKMEAALNAPTVTNKEKLYKSLDIDIMEKAKYFELNSQMFASGNINLETSQFIYNKLRSYEKTSLAERIVLTQVMMELLQKRIRN